jgi:hypothetical protein
MKAFLKLTSGAALLASALLVNSGCKDKRIDSVNSPDREVTVEAPGADVRVNSPPATPLVPRPGEGVDLNVGPGGVQVDVEGAPLRERVRELREENKPATP